MTTAANFHLATEAVWTMIDNGNVDATWSRLVDKHGLFYESFSGSAYVISGDMVYRKADHWGAVATCAWILAKCASNMPGLNWASQHAIIESGHGHPQRTWVVACCKLEDFRPIGKSSSVQYHAQKRASELMKQIQLAA